LLDITGFIQFMPILSIIVGVIAIVGFFNTRKAAAVAEGKRQQELEQLERDVKAAHEKIRELEAAGKCTDGDIRELKTDMKHVLDALSRIEERLQK